MTVLWAERETLTTRGGAAGGGDGVTALAPRWNFHGTRRRPRGRSARVLLTRPPADEVRIAAVLSNPVRRLDRYAGGQVPLGRG